MAKTSSVLDREPSRDGVAPALENLLLAAMPDREQLAPFVERFALDQEESLYETGAPITHYVFPVRGVLSLVKEMQGGTVEVGTVGPEGMVALSALLGVRTTSTRIFAQSDMLLDRIQVDHLDAVCDSSSESRRLLLRYANAFHEEVSQSVACNRLHSLEERCARWLLMTHDRTGTDTMQLKQRFLSYMLGVHRPAVSLAAGALQRAGFIRYSRGAITIIDRAGLEEAACECYAFGREAFARARVNLNPADAGSSTARRAD
jgi:CRP-like cAMP-binding protein